jgi:hypothetical protein
MRFEREHPVSVWERTRLRVPCKAINRTPDQDCPMTELGRYCAVCGRLEVEPVRPMGEAE